MVAPRSLTRRPAADSTYDGSAKGDRTPIFLGGGGGALEHDHLRPGRRGASGPGPSPPWDPRKCHG